MVNYNPADIGASDYSYLPSLSANIFGLVLFTIFLVFHIISGAYTRQWWFASAWSMGLALQVLGYACRVTSHYNSEDLALYKVQLIVLILSPSFLMAGIYYQFARLVVIFGSKYSLLRPISYLTVFITSDAISMILQVVGLALTMVYVETDQKMLARGTHILLGGLAFQAFTIVIFTICFLYFWWNVYHDSKAKYDEKWFVLRHRPLFKYLMPAIAECLVFLLIRSAYRVAEVSEGWNGHLISHEKYVLLCDGLMVLSTCAVMTAIYPGFVLGKESAAVKIIEDRHKSHTVYLIESELYGSQESLKETKSYFHSEGTW